MDDGKSKAIDVREWKPPKWVAGKLNIHRSTVIARVDRGEYQAVITGGAKRRTIRINPQGIVPDEQRS